MSDVSGKSPFRRVGLILLFAGVAMAGGGGYAYQREIAFEQSAQRAEGVVANLARNARPKDSSPSTYAAVVDFTDTTGQMQEFVERVSSYPPRFTQGDKVTLLYDPANPLNAVIDDRTDRFFMTMVLSALSAAFMVLGAIVLFAGRSRRWTTSSTG